MIEQIAGGVGIILAIAIIVWAVIVEKRIGDLNRKLAASREHDADMEITDDVHALTDGELLALVGKILSSRAKPKVDS